MKKLFFIFPFIFIAPQINAQVVKSLYLLNQKDSMKVPYATIKVLHTTMGTFSDENGKFDIPVTGDTILISSIGFQAKKMRIDTLSGNSILLEPLFTALPEVVLKRKIFAGKEVFGISNTKFDFLWGPSGKGEEFAQKIMVPFKENETIRIIKITVPAQKFDNHYPVLLHIYEEDEATGLPGKELLQRPYVVTKNDFKGKKIVVDVAGENLILNGKNIFVSFQWLSKSTPSDKENPSGTLLQMTSALPQELTYFRRLSSSKYSWIPALRVPDHAQPSNTMFSIEVERYQ